MMNLVSKNRDRFFAPAGDRVIEKHTLSFDDQGNKKLVAAPSFDQYAYIQSFARDCDINMMIARYDAGDVTALQRTPGSYGSAAGLSSNFADYFAANKAMEAYFESDQKARQIYGDDFKRFLKDLSSGSYVPGAKESEVKEGGTAE